MIRTKKPIRQTPHAPGFGLRNPCCGSNQSKVYSTLKKNGMIERHRECLKCGGLFRTLEVVERLTRFGDPV